MKTTLVSFLFAALAASISCLAAPPVGAPAGASGLCKDGTYDSSVKKAGACAGHKGVKDWWGAAAKADAKAGAKADASKAPDSKATVAAAAAGSGNNTTPARSASTGAKPAKQKVPPPVAAGGGADKVWVNEDSKVYHCPGSRWYGKTKSGKYMSEAEAKAAGNKPDHGKTCK